MIRLWHYWVVYGILLALVASALGWLTREVLLLDRAEATSRRQAELEDNIGRAMWRMDVHMMPVIAKEAARPYFLYWPFYVPPSVDGREKSGAPIPSPLLTERSDFVVMNFQLNADNQCTSAQLPDRTDWERALLCGAKTEELQQYESKVAEFQDEIGYHDLLARLPQESFQDALKSSPVEGPPNGPSTGNSIANGYGSAEDAVPNQSQAQPPMPQAASPAGYLPLPEITRLQRSQSLNTLDMDNRSTQFQNWTQQEYLQQRGKLAAMEAEGIREGIARPIWVGERLLLARRVEVDGEAIIQGCWLDWAEIRKSLLSEITDLLPEADLVPIADTANANVNRVMATLPVELVVRSSSRMPLLWSTMRTSLVVSWLSFFFVAIGAALLLRGVLTLSARRAVFVSAVTHELRTPLTTFRMYAEMLAQGMVLDSAKRQQYLDTLRVEADRLGHLVENVLAYARLENGRPARHREIIGTGDLLDRITTRLRERAVQAEMSLVVHASEAVRNRRIETDPGAVEQILFNLVDNACKYAARAKDRRITLTVEPGGRYMQWIVADQGPGIASDVARRLFRPFSKSAEVAARTAPGVGLGLALSRRLARDLGGQLNLDRSSGVGSRFILRLPAQD